MFWSVGVTVPLSVGVTLVALLLAVLAPPRPAPIAIVLPLPIAIVRAKTGRKRAILCPELTTLAAQARYHARTQMYSRVAMQGMVAAAHSRFYAHFVLGFTAVTRSC